LKYNIFFINIYFQWWIAYLKVDEIVLLGENYMKIGMRISLLLKEIFIFYLNFKIKLI
jgi:hypothetical protein